MELEILPFLESLTGRIKVKNNLILPFKENSIMGQSLVLEAIEEFDDAFGED
jgi:hypothetical protein